MATTGPGALSRRARRFPPPTAGSGKGISRGAGQGSPERLRSVIVAAALAIGLGAAALFLFQSAGPAYACDSLLSPGPSEPAPTETSSSSDASAAPTPTQRVGFSTIDMGVSHVTANSTVRYAFCPPTSGSHWEIPGRAPLPRDFYSPTDSVSPGQWVHNLEHGYVILAYRGQPDRPVTEALRGVFDEAPPSPIAVQCGLPNKLLVLRFDDIGEPFALLAWDRALLMSEFDREQALIFIEQWQDSAQAPERAC